MSEALSRPAGQLARPARLLGDRRLAERVARGDARAFDELYRRHYQQIFRYCRSILRNDEDARDALQNTMAKALRSLPGDGREIRLKPWLFRVAHNECIDFLRSNRPTETLEGTEPAAAQSVESQVAGQERLRQVLGDVAQLPERQRSVLVMRELNDLGFDDISEAVGSSPAACRQTLYEARQALQVMEEGRSMDCADVRAAISDGDRRVLRGRTLRAHLRGCDGCEDFRAGIEARQTELRAMVPFLPVAAAASILSAITGGGGGIGGGLIGLFGGGSGSAAAGASVAAGSAGGGGAAAAGAGAGIGAGFVAGVSGKAVAVLAVTVGLGAGAAGVATQQSSLGSPESGPAAPALVGNGPGTQSSGAGGPSFIPVAGPAADDGRRSGRDGAWHGSDPEKEKGHAPGGPGHRSEAGDSARGGDQRPMGHSGSDDSPGESSNGHGQGAGGADSQGPGKGHGSRPASPGQGTGGSGGPGTGSGRPQGPPSSAQPNKPSPPNRPVTPPAGNPGPSPSRPVNPSPPRPTPPGPAPRPAPPKPAPPKPAPAPKGSGGNGSSGDTAPPASAGAKKNG